MKFKDLDKDMQEKLIDELGFTPNQEDEVELKTVENNDSNVHAILADLLLDLDREDALNVISAMLSFLASEDPPPAVPRKGRGVAMLSILVKTIEVVRKHRAEEEMAEGKYPAPQSKYFN